GLCAHLTQEAGGQRCPETLLGHEWSCDQQLSLRKVCLGENAKDEISLVEITPPEDSKALTAMCVATLKLSVLPVLKSGSGPVYFARQHLSVGFHWDGDGDQEKCFEEGKDATESFSKEASPVKAVNIQPRKHAFAVKKEQQQSVQEQSLGNKASRIRKPALKGELCL
uniref:Nucleoplasmin core domain-containing protein n=1 Tax=Podarcis muralis TaxID=64176 RepID=A0A670JIJ2_PODMU